jgi:hypothetical protein
VVIRDCFVGAAAICESRAQAVVEEPVLLVSFGCERGTVAYIRPDGKGSKETIFRLCVLLPISLTLSGVGDSLPR